MSTPKHLIDFLQGMADLWPHSPPDYLPPNGGGFAQDRKSLGGDVRGIGQDMRRALSKHEQTSANPR